MCKHRPMCMRKPMSIHGCQKISIRPAADAEQMSHNHSCPWHFAQTVCVCHLLQGWHPFIQLSAPRAFHSRTKGSYLHTAILHTSMEPEHFISPLQALHQSFQRATNLKAWIFFCQSLQEKLKIISSDFNFGCHDHDDWWGTFWFTIWIWAVAVPGKLKTNQSESKGFSFCYANVLMSWKIHRIKVDLMTLMFQKPIVCQKTRRWTLK